MLNRDLADRRVYPAIELNASGTRKEERLLSPDMLEASREIRHRLADLPSSDSMQQLLTYMKRTKSNEELVQQVMAI